LLLVLALKAEAAMSLLLLEIPQKVTEVKFESLAAELQSLVALVVLF
jgi:hypothetical protein